MKLHCLSLPGTVLLAWRDAAWVSYILPSDSIKKRFVKTLVSSSLSRIFSKYFNGKLIFGNQSVDLQIILDQLKGDITNPQTSAIFVNSRRDTPRIYLWLMSEGVEYFIKIGLGADYEAFNNELKVMENKHELGDIQILSGRKLFRHDNLSILLSKGLSEREHQQKKRMLPHEILRYFSNRGLSSEGFFGGRVHCDLSSNNVFSVGNRLIVLDWESSVELGPRYCDLIELGSAMLVSDPVKRKTLRCFKSLLNNQIGFCPSESSIRDSLEFLSNQGNKNAIKLLANTSFLNSMPRKMRRDNF